jgi:hypothetical protein
LKSFHFWIFNDFLVLVLFVWGTFVTNSFLYDAYHKDPYISSSIFYNNFNTHLHVLRCIKREKHHKVKEMFDHL